MPTPPKPLLASLERGPAFDVRAALERFAPEVRFHPTEKHLPTSVDWYLERVELWLDRMRAGRIRLHEAGQVDVPALIGQEVDGQRSGAGDRSGFFLAIPNDADLHRTRCGDMDRARCYAHARPALRRTDAYDLQYWFFFSYNGDMGPGPISIAHEADWEHVTVRVNADGTRMLGVFLSAHDDEGGWHGPGSFGVNGEGRPIVYCARHSHATFPFPGEQLRTPDLRIVPQLDRVLDYFPPDRTADGGPVWQTWNSLTLCALRARPVGGHDWLRFSGRWGAIGRFSFTSGPYGPAFQDAWYQDVDTVEPST